eukprot:Em0006g527a
MDDLVKYKETIPLRGPSSDFGSLRADPSERDEEFDVTGKAVQVCETWLLRPYRGALMMLGWLNICGGEGTLGRLQQGTVVMAYLCVIMTTFVVQGLLCFQRDVLFLSEEVCVDNETVDVDRVCCNRHIGTAFVVPDILILTSYLFGVYLFSSAETEHLSKLAEEVFIKTARATGGKYPKKLIATIGAYFLAGIAWIVCSLVLRLLYLVAFKYWNSDVAVYWSDTFQITGSTKHGLIMGSVIGFIFLDLVYAASIINYVIQSELNVYLLKAISRLADNKMYGNLDEVYKDISNAECNLRVLNGKTATGASLVIFKLSISAVVALQQLDQLTNGKALPPHGVVLSLVVASLNALLWVAMIVFAFVQASRVTGAGLGLKRSGVIIRSRPLQYLTFQQSDLDSFVLYTQAVKLRAKLFGVPVVPWVMYAAITVLCFVLIMLIKTDFYNPFPNV